MKSSDSVVPGIPQPVNLRALEGKDFIKNPVASGIEGEDVSEEIYKQYHIGLPKYLCEKLFISS